MANLPELFPIDEKKTFKTNAAFTPEEQANISSTENHPDILKTNLADIEQELKKPNLHPLVKSDLQSEHARISSKLKGGDGSLDLFPSTSGTKPTNPTSSALPDLFPELSFDESKPANIPSPTGFNQGLDKNGNPMQPGIEQYFKMPQGSISDITKKTVSSGGKLLDTVLSPFSMALGYGLGGVQGGLEALGPNPGQAAETARRTKNEVMEKASIDKLLQKFGIAQENPELLSTALENTMVKGGQQVANLATSPGTLSNDVLRDALLLGVPLGAHKALGKLAERNVASPEPLARAPEVERPPEQLNLFPEEPGPKPAEPAQALPEIPPSLDNLLKQAKEEPAPTTEAPQSLPDLFEQARADTEPSVVPAEEIAQTPALAEKSQVQESLPLEEPNQVASNLDKIGENEINTDNPSPETLLGQKDRPLVMSPESVFNKFGINEDTLSALKGWMTGLNSPIWKRREIWVDNPILRSVLDNTREISDRINAVARTALERGNDQHPLKNLNTLDGNEKLQYSKLKTMYEGKETETGATHFTKEQWMEKGASDKVANALVESGKSYDVALDIINRARQSTRLAPIDRIPNYMPRQHAYPFRVTVTDKVTGESRVSSHPTLNEARKVAENLNNKLDTSKYSIDYNRQERTNSSYMDSIESFANKYKGTEPSPFNKMMQSIYDKMNQSFLGATKERTGGMQYTGSHKFKTTSDPATIARYKKDADFITSLPEKAVNDATRYAKDLQLKALKAEYDRVALEKGVAHTQAWKQIQELMDIHMKSYTDPVFQNKKVSIPEKVADTMAEYLDKTKIPGHVPQSFLKPKAIVDLTRGFGKLMLSSKISPTMNMALLPIQYAQFILSPINIIGSASRMIAKNTGTTIGDMAGQLGKTSFQLAEASVKAMYDSVMHQVDHATGKNFTSKDGNAALAWAKANGHLDSLLAQEHATFQTKVVRQITQQGLTEHAEQTPRSIAFLNGYYTAKNLGFPEGAARRAAVDSMNQVMGDYSKEGKPQALRSLDPLAGTVISQLSTFMLNTLAQLHTMTTGKGADKAQFVHSIAIPLVTFLGVSYLATGWGGMPGVRDYDTLVKYLNENFKTNLPTSFELNMHLHDVDAVGNHNANDAYYGWLSEHTGRDVSKSARSGSLIGFGQFLPGMVTSVGKSAYLEGKNALSKTGAVESPTTEELYRSRKEMTPPSMQYLTENAYAKERPNGDLVLREGLLRKKGESETRLFNPFDALTEKKERDVNNAANYAKQHQLDQTKRQLDLIKDKADRGESFTENFKKLVDLNPDYARQPSTVVQQVIENQINRRLTQTEQEYLKAAQGSSLNTLQDAQRRKQYLEKSK